MWYVPYDNLPAINQYNNRRNARKRTNLTEVIENIFSHFTFNNKNTDS